MVRTKPAGFFSRQISLRNLLIGGLALGALVGTFGPALAESFRDWRANTPAPKLTGYECELYSNGSWSSRETGYYESAETPLK